MGNSRERRHRTLAVVLVNVHAVVHVHARRERRGDEIPAVGSPTVGDRGADEGRRAGEHARARAARARAHTVSVARIFLNGFSHLVVLVEPSFFFLLRSQKSIPPERLPKPANTTNRPWGDHEMVLRCALPNDITGSALRLNSVPTPGLPPEEWGPRARRVRVVRGFG